MEPGAAAGGGFLRSALSRARPAVKRRPAGHPTRVDIQSDGFAYVGFSERVRLAEVLIGARCSLEVEAVYAALGNLSNSVAVHKVREAYKSFEVVKIDSSEDGV